MSTACENLFWCNFEFAYKKQALGILRIRMPFLDPTTFPLPSGSCPGAPEKKRAAMPNATEGGVVENVLPLKILAQRVLDLHNIKKF